MKRHVLITRPENDVEELSRALHDKGYKTTHEPFLTVAYHEENLEDLDKYDGIIFTSKNGVRAFCQNSRKRNIKIWTVGNQTKNEASKNGFDDIISADGNVNDLIALINEQAKNTELLYIRGEHISQQLTGVRITERILYHTEKNRKISKETVKKLNDKEFTHILFFSKRTADSFVDFIHCNPNNIELKNALKATQALCLGDSMIECLSVLPWQRMTVASEPKQNALLELLEHQTGD